MEDLRNLRPGEKALEIAREEQESSQHVPVGMIDLGSFEVLPDDGETMEDDVIDAVSSDEATGTMRPLPPRNALQESSKT